MTHPTRTDTCWRTFEARDELEGDFSVFSTRNARDMHGTGILIVLGFIVGGLVLICEVDERELVHPRPEES